MSVVTVASGRHDHLAAQLNGLTISTVAPWEHVVVAMGDKGIHDVPGVQHPNVTCVDLAVDGALPLAQARNLGAEIAIAGGAELLVFLDVDCIPSRGLLARYWAAGTLLGNRRSLLCGPVTYLSADDTRSAVGGAALAELTRPHPARPDPPSGTVEHGHDYDLFWSLSFALTPSTWTELGGFCEDYTGYGGEDTDLAATAEASGIGLRWVGGAHAYHQYHPVSSPPVEHLDDIVSNARTFFGRWGRWPMVGWLDEFDRLGLVDRNHDGYIQVRSP